VNNETALSRLLSQASPVLQSAAGTHDLLYRSIGCSGLAHNLCAPWTAAASTFIFWLGMAVYAVVMQCLPPRWPTAELHILPMLLVRYRGHAGCWCQLNALLWPRGPALLVR
jgi:hypothetical protein